MRIRACSGVMVAMVTFLLAASDGARGQSGGALEILGQRAPGARPTASALPPRPTASPGARASTEPRVTIHVVRRETTPYPHPFMGEVRVYHQTAVYPQRPGRVRSYFLAKRHLEAFDRLVADVDARLGTLVRAIGADFRLSASHWKSGMAGDQWRGEWQPWWQGSGFVLSSQQRFTIILTSVPSLEAALEIERRLRSLARKEERADAYFEVWTDGAEPVAVRRVRLY